MNSRINSYLNYTRCTISYSKCITGSTEDNYFPPSSRTRGIFAQGYTFWPLHQMDTTRELMCLAIWCLYVDLGSPLSFLGTENKLMRRVAPPLLPPEVYFKESIILLSMLIRSPMIIWHVNIKLHH